MRQPIKALAFLAFVVFLLLPALTTAQSIPAGFVQTSATIPSLADGTFGAAWTNLSSSPQLGLLGCQSTFQTTVNGNFDAYGHFTTLLADTAQICPSPSTWTFTFSFACPVGFPPTAFMVAVPVTGGGGTEDISAEINAVLPSKPCGGGTGGNFLMSVNGTPLITSGSANLINSDSITVTNPSTNQVRFTLVNQGCTSSGVVGQLQGANGSGGCSPEDVEVNGSNLNLRNAPNFVNGINTTVSNPATNEVEIDVSSTPASLQTQIVPPIAGQFVIIYPTGFTTNILGGATVEATNTSAVITIPPNFSFTNEGQVIWTFVNALSTEAPYVNPSNVTAVYAFGFTGISSANVGSALGPFYPGTLALGIGGANVGPPGYAVNTNTPLQQVSTLTVLTGSTISSATGNLTFGYSGETGAQSTLSVPLVGFIVYYTGTAPPVSTALNIVPPLDYNVATNTLSIDPTAQFSGLSLVPTVVGRLPAPATQVYLLYAVSDGASTTDCTTGGGSTYVQCLSNGTSWVAYSSGGGGGSIPGGALGSVPYQSAANTTALVAGVTTSSHAFFFGEEPSGSLIAPAFFDLGTFLGTNIVASSPIVATPTTLGVSLSCPTCGVSGSGTNFTVLGGSTLGSANFNATSPTADASYLALLPKISGGDFIVEAPYATGAAFGVMKGDASTITMTAGVASCTTATSSQLGCLKPDGTIITDTAGAITVPKSSSSVFGVAKVDGTSIVASSGVISATPPFSSLTSATNTGAAMVVGTGASLGVSGSGTIAATTSLALASSPTGCTGGQFATGIAANGNAACATPSGTGITLSTTGASGLATLSGSALNIPHYAGSGTNSDITSLTGLTSLPSAGLTGYLYGNGSSPVTASTTIPGSAIVGNIPGNAANLYGSPTLPSTVAGVTSVPSGGSDTRVATKADVYNATTSTTIAHYLCKGTMALSGTVGPVSTAAIGTATCAGLVANTPVIGIFNGNVFTIGGFIPSANGTLSVSFQTTTNTITLNAGNSSSVSQTVGSGAIVTYEVID